MPPTDIHGQCPKLPKSDKKCQKTFKDADEFQSLYTLLRCNLKCVEHKKYNLRKLTIFS